ncbi:MAG: hypothetical protein M5U09_14705 [Gammaproteobacteria bacterium]|nr:hypothetical protein [Gammaproteobacteria bacterium]
MNASSIAAIVGALSAAVGVGSTGVGVSIGAAIALNKIGFDLSGDEDPLEVHAFIFDSSIDAGGAMTLDADANQRIDAVVLAGSVAIAAGSVGVAVSGSGVFVFNQIGADVAAFIMGDPNDLSGAEVEDGNTEIIEAGSIAINAGDTSTINTVAGAASAAAAFGSVGVAVSIGGAVAVNEITTSVDARITNMEDGIAANDFSNIMEGGGRHRYRDDRRYRRQGRTGCGDQRDQRRGVPRPSASAAWAWR